MMKRGRGLAILLLVALAEFSAGAEHKKVCAGTSGGISRGILFYDLHQFFRDRFINCTHVNGNLEITWNKDDDFSTLKDIREVTGYVRFSVVGTRRLVLPNLTIIRGRNLFSWVGLGVYALYVRSSTMETVELPALREISSGGVTFEDNKNLCYVNTINWEEILVNKSAPIDNKGSNDICPLCHETCEHGCWGPGTKNCQIFSKLNCSPHCHQRRCFGPSPLECCHSECAAGCSGPTRSDCLFCKHFDDYGVCREACPSMKIYNATTLLWEINPDGKYAYGYSCVKNCPEHFLRDDGACVRFCPDKKKDIDGECVSCDGPCPKRCKGVEVVHSGNIHTFKDCTILEGSVKISFDTFRGYGIKPDQLEVFSTLKEITDFVRIDQAEFPYFNNLSYFRNLEIVHGRKLTDLNAALYIADTSLRSLDLHSLRKLRSGDVVITGNHDLCFAEETEWRRLMTHKTGSVIVKDNAGREKCIRRGLVCHEQCSSDGCWGSKPDECLSCKYYKLKETCVPSCNESRFYDAGNNICEFCDEECLKGCSGPGPSNCTQCRHARDGSDCVGECPVGKYSANGECKPCYESCATGCTGPRNAVGPGGCNSCDKAVVNAHDRNIATCKYFDDNGVCKEECPPLRRYNPATDSWEINPDGRYAYGHMCVKKCPEPFLGDSGACVRSCPETKRNVHGECVACDGACAKTCKGVEIVHARNIQTFKGCTIIEGSLKIVGYAFRGFKASHGADRVIPKMHPDELEVFSTLKEVTGFVSIIGYHPDFRNLSYFRNLEIVHGRELTDDFEHLVRAVLYIYATSLRSLNLRSLREMRSGHVVIYGNPDLCFAEEIQWRQLMTFERGTVSCHNNAGLDKCKRLGLVCNDQCSSDGCWGSGPDECLSCNSYKLKEACVPGCDATRGIYDAGNNTCEFCNEECLLECSGPGPSSCIQCRHVRDGSYCVRECPIGKYNESGECKPCPESCTNGCTGPRDTVAPGGCNEAIRSDLDITVPCLKTDETCPVGYYEEYIDPREEGLMKSLTGKTACRKCHRRCKHCTAYGVLTSVCDCFNYSDGEICVDACPRDHYADNTSLQCVKCAEECRGCYGPSSTECNDSREYRVSLSADQTAFNCTSSWPAANLTKFMMIVTMVAIVLIFILH